MRVIVDYLGTKHDLTGLLILLSFSAFGFAYKRVENIFLRKWIGTLLGLLMAALFFGKHLWHFVFTGVSTVWIIKAVGPKKCHLAAFTMMFLYITVFRIILFHGDGEKDKECQNLLLMMLTFKIVGVAFEVHAAGEEGEKSNTNIRSLTNKANNLVNLSFSDMFHYAFSYLGLLTGPYFRYQVYDDFINLQFSRNVTNVGFVLWKLFQVFFFTAIQLSFQSYWPLEYIYDKDFEGRSLLYKCLFATLQWQRFKYWMYLGLSVAECTSGAAGLGAYPREGKSITSYGPTENKGKFDKISDEEAKTLIYDFKTITTIQIFEYEMAYSLVDAVRVWNMSIQYWLAIYIYRNLAKDRYSKTQRALVTTMVCALWHSVDIGIFLTVLLLMFYLKTEQIYTKILSNYRSERISQTMKIGMWLARFFICPFCTMPFLLESGSKIYFYFCSIYFSPLVFQVGLHVMGQILLARLNNDKAKQPR